MSSHSLPPPARARSLRHTVLVFAFALILRLVFALLTGGTYDYDEFVLLLLARDFAHGAVPYSQFMFFHPPGVLLVLRALEPLTVHWWQAARVLMIVLDACTAALLCRIGGKVLSPGAGIAAGILYAASPLALISAVRVGQDPMMTFLLVLGVAILVERSSLAAAGIAGACLALAAWIKYPALAFLPVYLVLGWRRAPAILAGGVVAFLLLLAPFSGQLHELFHQTVEFQRARWKMQFHVRLETALIWWLLVNPLAVLSLASHRPLWLKVGFLTGGLFLLASQVYYHYFVPIVPFASLLAAPLALQLVKAPRAVVPVVAATVTLLWALIIDRGGASPLYVTAAHLSDIQPTVRILDKQTGKGSAVLSDRLEYQYLARRPALDDYFWNIGVLVNARYLERRAPHAGAVVMSYGASSGFPRGFSQWLDRRYHRVDTGPTTIWLPRSELKTK